LGRAESQREIFRNLETKSRERDSDSMANKGKEHGIEAPVAIADSNDVPSIFGRVSALDRFNANFLKGERVKLRWEE